MSAPTNRSSFLQVNRSDRLNRFRLPIARLAAYVFGVAGGLATGRIKHKNSQISLTGGVIKKESQAERSTFSGKLVPLSTEMLLVDSHLLITIGIESAVGSKSVHAVRTMLQVLVHLGNSWELADDPVVAPSMPGG